MMTRMILDGVNREDDFPEWSKCQLCGKTSLTYYIQLPRYGPKPRT